MTPMPTRRKIALYAQVKAYLSSLGKVLVMAASHNMPRVGRSIHQTMCFGVAHRYHVLVISAYVCVVTCANSQVQNGFVVGIVGVLEGTAKAPRGAAVAICYQPRNKQSAPLPCLVHSIHTEC